VQPESLDEFADGLGIMDEINQPGNTVPANGANMSKSKNKKKLDNGLQPSTSTPIVNVPPPNIARGAPPGVVTRSAARYLSTCLYLSVPIVPFVLNLILSNLIYSNLSFVVYPLLL